MNFSKLIWIGSCVGGLLSCMSSVEVVTSHDDPTPSPDAIAQSSPHNDSAADSDGVGADHPSHAPSHDSLIDSSSSSSSRTRSASDHPMHYSLLSFYIQSNIFSNESPDPSSTADESGEMAASSFFSALSNGDDTAKGSESNTALSDSGSPLPLVSVEAMDEAIAPVVHLSRDALEQMTQYGTVAVLPHRPEPIGSSTPTTVAPQTSDYQTTLPSLKTGMIDQCPRLLWQAPADSSETVASRGAVAATPVSLPQTDTPTDHRRHVSDASVHPINERSYRVFVNARLVAEFPNQAQAQQFAAATQSLLQTDGFDPTTIKPHLVNGEVAIATPQQTLVVIDDNLTRYTKALPVTVAIAWSNNLRTALEAASLTLADAQASLQTLEPTGQQLHGTASWYGPYFHGRLTASGERFDQEAMTAAHPSLPFDTYLRVTNLENGQSVVVRINDRGPYIGDRSLDLSRQAAECLGSEITGVVPYDATILKPANASSQSFMSLVSRS